MPYYTRKLYPDRFPAYVEATCDSKESYYYAAPPVNDEFRCVGFAPSKHRGCHNPIASTNRDFVVASLAQIRRGLSQGLNVDEALRIVAGRALCLRYHQSQAGTVATEWKGRLLKEERRKVREAERRASEKNASPSVQYTQSWTAAEEMRQSTWTSPVRLTRHRETVSTIIPMPSHPEPRTLVNYSPLPTQQNTHPPYRSNHSVSTTAEVITHYQVARIEGRPTAEQIYAEPTVRSTEVTSTVIRFGLTTPPDTPEKSKTAAGSVATIPDEPPSSRLPADQQASAQIPALLDQCITPPQTTPIPTSPETLDPFTSTIAQPRPTSLEIAWPPLAADPTSPPTSPTPLVRPSTEDHPEPETPSTAPSSLSNKIEISIPAWLFHHPTDHAAARHHLPAICTLCSAALSPNDSLSWCKSCGRNVHRACLDAHTWTQRAAGACDVRCVSCKATWEKMDEEEEGCMCDDLPVVCVAAIEESGGGKAEVGEDDEGGGETYGVCGRVSAYLTCCERWLLGIWR